MSYKPSGIAVFTKPFSILSTECKIYFRFYIEPFTWSISNLNAGLEGREGVKRDRKWVNSSNKGMSNVCVGQLCTTKYETNWRAASFLLVLSYQISTQMLKRIESLSPCFSTDTTKDFLPSTVAGKRIRWVDGSGCCRYSDHDIRNPTIGQLSFSIIIYWIHQSEIQLGKR